MGPNCKEILICALSLVFFLSHALGAKGEDTSNGDAELRALLHLKRSLHVQDSAWPMQADPCSTWTGIQCEKGHVVSVLFPALGHRQPILAMNALQKLHYLRNLNASELLLSGSLPEWFGFFPQLETLDLSSTSLEGGIPLSFRSLSSLRSLSLAQNHLSGPILLAFDKLSNLTYLDLSSNHISGPFPDSLLKATGLVSLDLSSNHLTGVIPSGVGRLTNLHHLSLAANSFQGSFPVHLLELSSLKYLNLAFNQFSGPLPDLPYLSRLTVLNVAKNQFSGTIPSNISHYVDLQILILSHNLLTGELPPTLGSLKNLVYISLSSNSFTGVVPASLLNLPRLRSLQLSHNLLYGQLTLSHIQHTALMALDFSFNFLNGSIPRGLVSTTASMKNCFDNVAKQHTLRACRLFYKRKGLSLNGLLPQTVLPKGGSVPLAITENKLYRTKRLATILAGVAGGVLTIIFIGTLTLCFNKYERGLRVGEMDKAGEVEAARSSSAGAGVFSINFNSLGEAFSFDQLRLATNNFSPSCLIATGHSGDLYKGTLDGGAAVVVKRIQSSKVSKELYVNELELFGRASHTRLVSLLGHCLVAPDEKFMVYKYMTNGDLASALQRKGDPDHDEDLLPTLDWITRMKIAIGVAEGLTYLHHECYPPIVHRNIKASSILLDEKFEVRLGSLSDACVQGGEPHPGLIARFLGLSQSSDQAESGSFTASCGKDVYCFGKVLLELLSGKVEISNQCDPHIDSWVESALSFICTQDKESLSKLVDPSLIIDEDLLDEVWAVTIVAKACLNPKPSKRPSMRHILKALENPHKAIREELNDAMVSRTSSHSSWNEALFWGSRTANFSQSPTILGPNV